MRRSLALILALIVLASISSPQSRPARPIAVSMIQLIATPDKYDGKIVAVTGFLNLQYEGDAIYLHREDYRNDILENSFGVDTTEDMRKNKETLQQKYVRIVGAFHAGQGLRYKSFLGRITNIEACSVVSDPDHPLVDKIREMREKSNAPLH
jgi:hypothetical protein